MRLFAFAMQETALPPARLSGERARTSGQMRLFATLLRRGDVEGVRIDCALPQRSPAAPRSTAIPHGARPGGGIRRQQLPAGVLHRGWRYRRRARRWLPGRVQGAQRPYDHRRAERSGDRARPETYGDACRRLQHDLRQPRGADTVQHPAIQAVGFTGSLQGGRALFDLATRRPHPIRSSPKCRASTRS